MKSSPYFEYVLEQLSPMQGISGRAMFGGYGVYRDGLMFALIDDDQLYFKVDDSNRSDYEKAGGMPFQYTVKGKKVTLSYWSIPPEMPDDRDELCSWGEKAYKVAVNSKKARVK